MRRVLVLLSAAVALYSVAGAQPPARRFAVAAGVVKSVSLAPPTAITITRADGTDVTFILTDTTQIVKEKGASVSSGLGDRQRRDVKPGDQVRVVYDGTRAAAVYVEERQQ